MSWWESPSESDNITTESSPAFDNIPERTTYLALQWGLGYSVTCNRVNDIWASMQLIDPVYNFLCSSEKFAIVWFRGLEDTSDDIPEGTT